MLATEPRTPHPTLPRKGGGFPRRWLASGEEGSLPSSRAGLVRTFVILVFAALPFPAPADDEGLGRVEILRAPDGGLQPQAAIDGRGTIHLIFFRGEPAHGDLYYVKRNPGTAGFVLPIRVNSEMGSAVAMGTIRGGQIAAGKQGKVHAVWNGATATPDLPAPFFYTRLKPAEGGFEPQRSLSRVTTGLDGGGTVAADGMGRVFVAFHARGVNDPPGESNRRLWVARSEDDGATFATEQPALDRPTGACACCGTRALVDVDGRLSVLFRSAANGVDRDLTLVTSSGDGERFSARRVHPWRVAACPMSSAALAESVDGPVAAWETAGQVYFARLSDTSKPVAPPGRPGNRKHPSLAVAPDGSVLLAWTEGTDWQKGGDLAWRLFTPEGRPTEVAGRVKGGIPVWSLPSVVARPDGGFTLFH